MPATEKQHAKYPPDGEPVVGAVARARAWYLATSATLNRTAGTTLTRLRATLSASPTITRLHNAFDTWLTLPGAAALTVLGSMAFFTLVIALAARVVPLLPSPGVVYLPLVAMYAYHWDWRSGALAGLLDLVCTYFFFTPPYTALKPLDAPAAAQLLVLAAVICFMLALVQLARSQRDMAEREAGRFAALNSVGTSLASELQEGVLLRRIAQTARDLTGAEFAAFTLRPLGPTGEPLVPAEGSLFHLAAVVGVTPEQEASFRRVPLGGEGLLAPIFRHGIPVRVDDALGLAHQQHAQSAQASTSGEPGERESPRDAARRRAQEFAQGHLAADELRSVGVPRGHPIVRSFLGVPLFDREGRVRGGLLLGHSLPEHFTAADQALLLGLSAQAGVALENARLYRNAQTSGAELDAIFESIADGVSLVDTDGAVLRENAAARDLRLALDAQGTPGGYRAMVRQLLAAAHDGHLSLPEPITITSADGDARDYVASATPLKPIVDDAPPAPADALGGQDAPQEGVVIIWHDVTEASRLLAERQARAEAEGRRALLQRVVDELPSGVYLVHGHDARLVLANHAATEVWGAQWSAGTPMSDFLRESGVRILRPDGTQLPLDELATLRAIRTGESVRHYQEIIRKPDGSGLPVLLNAVTITTVPLATDAPGSSAPDEASASSDEPVALVVLQDVTALKEAERLKDEFIAIAAHELKTPMTALKGYANMLTRVGGDDTLDDLHAEALEAIDQSTDRLVELTDDLLDVARLQTGSVELRREPVDLIALARRVVRRLAVTAPKHTLRVESDEEYVVACADVSRIEQVLTNLLNNAVKYSPDGGEVVISIRQQPDGRLAEVSVTDHGIGIPTEQQARVFGRFARADNARERGIKGTGLGLYLSRELVERQGGQIWFESEEGKGTTFHVTVPLATEEGAACDTPA